MPAPPQRVQGRGGRHPGPGFLTMDDDGTGMGCSMSPQPAGTTRVTIGCSNPAGLRQKEPEAVDLGPGIWSYAETQLSHVTFPTCSKRLQGLARDAHRQIRVFGGKPAPLCAIVPTGQEAGPTTCPRNGPYFDYSPHRWRNRSLEHRGLWVSSRTHVPQGPGTHLSSSGTRHAGAGHRGKWPPSHPWRIECCGGSVDL